MADMSEDVRIKRLLRRHGAEGYGVYCYILERIVRRLDSDSPTPDLEESAQDIASDLNIDVSRVESIVRDCCEQGLFELDELTGRVIVHKIYKFLQHSETRSAEIRALITQYKQHMSCLRLSETNVKTRLDKTRLDKKGESLPSQTKKGTHEGTGRPIGLARYERLLTVWGSLVDRYIEKAAAYADANGKAYKDYAAVAESWLTKDEEAGKVKRPKAEKRVKTFEEERKELFGE